MIFPLILAQYFILIRFTKNDKHIFTIFYLLSIFIEKDMKMLWTICVLFHQIKYI